MCGRNLKLLDLQAKKQAEINGNFKSLEFTFKKCFHQKKEAPPRILAYTILCMKIRSNSVFTKIISHISAAKVHLDNFHCRDCLKFSKSMD